MTDATVNRALSVLRHILYWAVDEQLIQANPLARLPLVRERRLKRPVMSVAEERPRPCSTAGLSAQDCYLRPRYRNAAGRNSQPALGGHRL